MPKKIQLIIGSTRQGRVAPSIAKWVKSQVQTRDDIELEVLDLKEIDLPFFAESVSPMYSSVAAEPGKSWTEKIAEGEGYIFLTAEYNRGYPAALKNAIDYIYSEWANKPAAIVSYGYIDGGQSAARQLQDVLRWVKLDVAEEQTPLVLTGEILDENGQIKNAQDVFRDHETNLQSALAHLAEHEATEPVSA